METTKPFKTTFVVSEGDWGGQIYFTIPKNMIHEDAEVIALTQFVNVREWECNESDGINVYEMNPYADFEQYGEIFNKDHRWNTVGCGMGGGLLIENEIWIHPDIPESLNKIIKSHLLFGKSFS